MKQKNIWSFILNELKSARKVSLLIVADSSNSSPGRQGFKMAINEDVESFGTIGGGIMENDMIEFALGLLFSEKDTDIKRLYHSNSTTHEKSGLICGGRQTVIIKILSEDNIKIIEHIIENLKNRKPGELRITPNDFIYTDNSDLKRIEFTDDESKWEYREQIGLTDTAYIVGGGHIGLAVSRVMKSIGFYVVVFDHRDDVFTLEQNEYADEIIICKYNEIGKNIIEGDKSYIIIATPMHAGDSGALKSVISKNLKYIGLMGSKRKIKTIFQTLLDAGIDNKLFSKVHTPIGLEIEAETPEEIAISIAAEIIKIKNTM